MLLRQFPPNETPEGIKAKFVFHGPLLMTEMFRDYSYGKQLINFLNGKGFTGEKIAANPSNADFGCNFKFHFFADPKGKYNGLVFNSSKSVPKPPLGDP